MIKLNKNLMLKDEIKKKIEKKHKSHIKWWNKKRKEKIKKTKKPNGQLNKIQIRVLEGGPCIVLKPDPASRPRTRLIRGWNRAGFKKNERSQKLSWPNELTRQDLVKNRVPIHWIFIFLAKTTSFWFLKKIWLT